MKKTEEKRKELVDRRQEIIKTIESHNEADNNVTITLIHLVKLASRAGKTFKGSTTPEKRKLINQVLVNLKLKDHKLQYDLRPPFDSFTRTAKNGEWWARQDLNLRPLRYERSALTN